MLRTAIIMSKRNNRRLSIASGVTAIVALLGVSFTLLYNMTAQNKALQNKFLQSRYHVTSPAELERKMAALGKADLRAVSELKNLDMPDTQRVEATLQKVSVFERVFTREEMCLAQAVYFEARGEPLIGQVAVAEVVLNRVVTTRYPNSACGVVFQNQHLPNRCQFSFACDGKSDRPQDLNAWERSLKVVALVMAGERSGVAKRATHYHASYVSPSWRMSLNKVGEVGRHIFYRDAAI